MDKLPFIILFGIILITKDTSAQEGKIHDFSFQFKFDHQNEKDSIFFTFKDSMGIKRDGFTQGIRWSPKATFLGYKSNQYFHPRQLDVYYVSPDGAVKGFNFLAEPGDSIITRIANNEFSFEGRGHVKLKCTNRILGLWQSAGRFNNGQDILSYFKRIDSLTNESLKIIDEIRQHMSKNAFDNLRMETIARFGGMKLSLVQYNLLTEADRKLVFTSYHNPIWNDTEEDKFKDSPAFKYSPGYIYFLLQHYRFDYLLKSGLNYDLANCYDYFKNKYSGEPRERILFELIESSISGKTDLRDLLDDALTWFRNPLYIRELRQFKSKFVTGVPAYNFTLADQNGKMRSLSEFKGKVVLLDFWFTGCKNCIDAHPYVDSLRKVFKDKDVVFISINTDKRKASWLKSIATGLYSSKITTPKVLNLNTGAEGMAHPVIENYQAQGAPTFKLIDKDGKLMAKPNDPRNDKGADMAAKIETALKQVKSSALRSSQVH
ncbi:thiol-disulfide isomerase/thioredoxin [Pedobacter sp. AK017]|uniref:TlpA family protein disulfide reductase n=1 Tax=Pedobacter sp. AK017 TaxID=2723073 RepID=UPI00161D503F|nr:TlpA disulfide reductase family protein [Pedobacter sp. AK017]MBB5440611.1 thiol-disulfide isomerase/thioredoxin [Pedobacter sp. AK017]